MPTNITLKRMSSGSVEEVLYPLAHWDHLSGKPATYPPTNHTHNASDVNAGTLSADRIPTLAQSKITNLVTDLSSKALKENSIYYIEGNTSGTAGTWTGTHSDITSYYDGLKVAYKIGIAGLSPDTMLNINNLGARKCYRNDGSLTTHLPVNTIVLLTYTTVGGTGRWVWADYDAVDDYGMRWITNVTAGTTITRYKIIMQGTDGRYYPLTINDSTAEDGKIVSTQEFLLDGYILLYNSLATTYTVGQQFGSYYLWAQQYTSGVINYTFNQLSGWTASMSIYLKGTVQNNGTFKLDNTTTRSWLTQTLPTTEDGFVYILLGYMHNATTAFTLTIYHPIYEYKDGRLRMYIPPHEHLKEHITDFPTSMPASDVYEWAKASTKPTYNASEIGGLGASYRWLTDTYINTWNAKANIVADTGGTITSWTADSTHSGYGYRGSKPISGVTTSDTAYVIFSAASADSGFFASVCDTYAGGVYVYSKVNNQNANIERIIIFKG